MEKYGVNFGTISKKSYFCNRKKRKCYGKETTIDR